MSKFKNVRDRSKSQKINTPARQVSFLCKKPKFSFEFLSGKYCISNCESREKAEVISTLHKLSKLSWREIYQLGKSGIGYEQFDLSQLHCSYPHDETFLNLDKITVFHKEQKIPIIGFKIEEVYYIFCIDRTFDAYDHGRS